MRSMPCFISTTILRIIQWARTAPAFACHKNAHAAPGRSKHHYSLDFPLNMRGLVLSAPEELRSVLQTRMPCEMEFTVIDGDPEHPTGSGTYVKQPSGAFTLRAEQGTCLGLMTWLFPTTMVQASAYTTVMAQ